MQALALRRRPRPKPEPTPLPGVAPLTLAFDAQTPEQISIRAPLTRTVAAGTTVLAQYKLAGSTTWRSAGPLFQVEVATLPAGAPAGIVDAFAGCIFDLQPGALYDVQLTVNEPGLAATTAVGAQSTRALPAAAPAANKTATPATLAAQLATLAPGDCLELAPGTYAPFTLAEARSGTATAPIYIRGASRADVVVHAPTGVAVLWAASYVVLENMTLRGSGLDSGTAASSAGIVFSTGLTSPQRNATIRHLTATGFDRFCKAYEPVIGRLVYNCSIVGNNSWAKTYEINPESGGPNYTWNDDGVSGPGQGNCFFDCSITGHGDTFKIQSSRGVFFSAATFMYRVACDRTGDDFAELDDATGNCAVYDCAVKNAGSGLSVDGIYGGPIYFFRNRVANTARGPIKPTSDSQNVAILSNTFLRTNSATGFGLYASASGANLNWRVRNNAILYRGTGDVIRWDASLPNLNWNHNAIYPASGANITLGAGRGAYNGLAAAKSALAPLMANDVAAPSDPFATPVALPADYKTEYTGSMDWSLAAGVSLRNTGVALAGITDGFSGIAPDIGAVIAGRLAANAGDGSSLPSWIRNQALNTWAALPTSNTLADLNPDNDPLVNPNYPGTAPWRAAGSHASIITAWCGAVADQDAAQLHWLNCGGHNDGYPAAAYALNLQAETPYYQRLNKPSGAVGLPPENYATEFARGIYAVDMSGRHRAQHTESFQFMWPGQGICTMSGILLANTGGAVESKPYISSPTTGEMTFRSAVSNQKGNGSFDAACYDPVRNVGWKKEAGGSNKFWKWSGPATDTWTAVGADHYLSGGLSLAYCPTHDLILVGNGDNSGTGSGTLNQTIAGGFGVFDPATGTLYAKGVTATYPVFTGAPALNAAWSTGLSPGLCLPQWEPSLGAFLAWDMSAGSTTQIMRITPPASGDPRTGAWAVDHLPVAGSNTVTPSPAAANGTYGRFAVYPKLGICVVVNAVGETGYFFKYKNV
ncbi:hypothetical protein ACPOLB_15990 [Rubrivivax sp. RP6-9]|uniref:hypothetical protein n=1 Tax=Rubrivivax sp. RP6-9 TaxID=3415750 RepID=UPI003CC569CD